MANTSELSKEERKKAKRVARKKQAPKKKRDYARGSKKRKVKKLARGHEMTITVYQRLVIRSRITGL